jgi:hypothetical protein
MDKAGIDSAVIRGRPESIEAYFATKTDLKWASAKAESTLS